MYQLLSQVTNDKVLFFFYSDCNYDLMQLLTKFFSSNFTFTFSIPTASPCTYHIPAELLHDQRTDWHLFNPSCTRPLESCISPLVIQMLSLSLSHSTGCPLHKEYNSGPKPTKPSPMSPLSVISIFHGTSTLEDLWCLLYLRGFPPYCK